MKQYLLSIYQPAEGDPPDNLAEIMRDLETLNDEMRAAGAWVFAAGLYPPSTATVLRATGSEVLVTDGPFAEGKEQIGGFTVIRAEDLDAALEWAGRLAQVVTLPIEVRPVQDR
ncbi:YciI family protein [Nocardia tengchongensis]|uniref:YciI family protein n=1 Tax=Nocardia tengchongensis TaxID=2055889 RepID=UPI003686C312